VRSVAAYSLPKVALVRQDGRKVEFPAHIDDGQPVFINFIYTTCTAICPPMSQAFAELQAALGAEQVRLVSVSIDPEQDTPRRLVEYANRFGAGPQWTFFTGTVEASVAVQKALGAYRGDKMNHTPLTLFRAAPGQPWVRLEGFATPQQMLQEYRASAR
jgi:protein SCO1/2